MPTSTTTLYGYLNDTAAIIRTSGYSQHSAKSQGVMFLDDQMVNYFNTPGMIGDPRSARLLLSLGSGETAVSGVPDGKMSLHLDNDRIGSVDFSAVQESEFIKLFNIIELITTTQNKTADQLSAIMASDNKYSGVFVENSCQISGTYNTLSHYYLVNNGTTYDTQPMIRNWVSFTANIGTQSIVFKIWTNKTSFMADYPFTTITAVLYPCQPSVLQDLLTVNNVAEMLQESSLNIVGKIGVAGTSYLGEEMRQEDHSGVYSFKCAYNNSTLGVGLYTFSFGALYKGRAPTIDEARNVIRDDLLFRTNSTADVWKNILPDLFAQASFMVVPIWNNYSVNASNETIKSGIYDNQSFVNYLKATYPDYPEADLVANLEVLVCATSDILLATLPNTANITSLKQIALIHPTYMGVLNTDPLFTKQAAETQTFCERLNNTMGTLQAAGMNNVVDSVDLYGRKHYKFTVGTVEFYVLIKKDFPYNG